jgi:CheY-like chemotaxis protein
MATAREMRMSKEPRATILIVDDQAINIQALSGLLREHYIILAANNGPRALEIARGSKAPDLILLDITMPGMDGFEVCRQLKAGDKTKKIPVIFITARSSTDDIVRGFRTGAVDYIPKPFQPEELLVRVETHIELHRSREEIRTLKAIIPICAHCKKMRDDEGYWKKVEEYISDSTGSAFSHGLCPDCVRELYPDIADSILNHPG